ncbi:syntaxin-6 isoform X1 [Vanacampus margaritifer]
MSMEDPFFVVKGEVQKAVSGAQNLHQRWSLLLHEGPAASKEELDWTTNELRNSLRSIEWDLEDLDETISIVESNPKKFNLDGAELAKRKTFISSTRHTVKQMKEHMSSGGGAAVAFVDSSNKQVLPRNLRPSAGLRPKWPLFNIVTYVQAPMSDGAARDKYHPPERRLRAANSDFMEEQQLQQQLMAEQQDEQLELVSGTIGVLKNMSERIGLELDEQAVMLDDFGHEMDNTHSRLDNVMKKLAKVSHMTSDRRQWCAIGVLLAVLLVVLVLLFVL